MDERRYSELKNLCVWVKNNRGMGSLYRSQHEFVFVFEHGRQGIATTSSLAGSAAIAATFGVTPAPTPLPARGEEGNLLALHPTVKPVAMVADAILDGSARGEIVLTASSAAAPR